MNNKPATGNQKDVAPGTKQVQEKHGQQRPKEEDKHKGAGKGDSNRSGQANPEHK